MSKNSISVEIFKNYGLPSVFITIIFAGIIWILTHFAAAGRSNVSVLWGLVEYTKKPSTTSEVTYESPLTFPTYKNISKSPSEIVELDSIIFQPINLFVKHNITEQNQHSFMDSLRAARQLREITAIESGKVLQRIPPGTYFFLSGVFLNTYSNYKNLLLKANDYPSDRYKSYNRFEIQHTVDGTFHLLGYINEIQAVDISQLSGKIEKEVIISPRLWGQMTSVISIPIERIHKTQTRDIQVTKDLEITVLDITVK